MSSSKLILPKDYDKSIVAVPWTDIDKDIKNPVRNTKHEYLHFINTAVFSEEARKYLKRGYYTDAPYGTKDYDDYWDEQEKRCLHGYSVGGVRITGRHYFYLNFCQIKARPIDPNTGKESQTKKIITFPRFLDHNYYFFHELEECFGEGEFEGQPLHGMVALKSRRKGFTYQVTGGIYNYNYQFIPASMNILAAYLKTHYKVTLDGIHFSINHINKATDWAKRKDVLRQKDHFRASLLYTNEAGMIIEDGYMSEVQAISFKDDPFKSIGESCFFIGFEEAGKFEHLLTAYSVAEPTLRDGDIFTGVPMFWGTGGDVEKGSADLAEIFYRPEAYGCKSYENIYEDNASGECGWFIDDMWYYPGETEKNGKIYPFVDINGNSYRDLAEESLDKKRKLKAKGSKHAYNKFITQQPKNPSEALMRVQTVNFDTLRCNARLHEIESNPSKYIDSIWIGKLDINPDTNKVTFRYDDSSIPLLEFPIRDNRQDGAIEIYEMPVYNSNGEITYGRYIAGIDPYDDDYSTTNSVGSMLVLDTFTDRIVCHYKGRPTANKFYENCRRILLFYNATANYERNKKMLYGYFYNKRALHLLTDEPEILREKGISKANTLGNNNKGTYGSISVNNYGLELATIWSENPAYGAEEGSEIIVIDKIRSRPLLKEMIAWNPDGNFDDISALGLLMIYREDKLHYTKSIQKEENSVSRIAQSPMWSRVKQKRLNKLNGVFRNANGFVS